MTQLPYQGMSPDEINQLREDVRGLIHAESGGVIGHLRQGEYLTRLAEVTSAMRPSTAVQLQQQIYDEEAGLTHDRKSKFPGEAQRSSLRATYKAWVVDAGIDYDSGVSHPDHPVRMSLGTVRNFSALRSLNGAVTKENAPKLMAFLHNYPWKVVSRVARHINAEDAEQIVDSFKGKSDEEIIVWGDERGGRPESEIKSFRVPAAVYDQYVTETVARIAPTIARVAPTSTASWPDTDEGRAAALADGSRTQVLEILIHAANVLRPEWVEGLVRDALGEHTEESYMAWLTTEPFTFVRRELN